MAHVNGTYIPVLDRAALAGMATLAVTMTVVVAGMGWDVVEVVGGIGGAPAVILVVGAAIAMSAVGLAASIGLTVRGLLVAHDTVLETLKHRTPNR